MALLPQHVHDELGDDRLILDDQDAARHAFAHLFGGGSQDRSLLFLLNWNYGEFDEEFDAAARLVFKGYFPTVLLDDAIDDGKAQAGADSRGLRRKKRIENARCNFGGDTGAVVGDFKENTSGSGLRPPGKQAGGPNPHIALAPAFSQGVLCVDHQIQDHLLKLKRVGHGFGQIVCEVKINYDVFDAQFVAAEREGALDNFVKVHNGSLGAIFAREVQEIFHDAPCAFGFLIYMACFGKLHGKKAMAEKKLRVTHDGRERVIKFVSDARNDLTERRHFFRLEHFRLNLALASYIRPKLQPSHVAAFRVEHRTEKALEDSPSRTQDFEFVVSRLVRTRREGFPTSGKGSRITEPVRQQVFEILEFRDACERPAINPEKLAESVTCVTHVARRINQHHACCDGIEYAAKFGLRLPPLAFGTLHDGTLFQAQEQVMRTRKDRAECDADRKAGGESCLDAPLGLPIRIVGCSESAQISVHWSGHKISERGAGNFGGLKAKECAGGPVGFMESAGRIRNHQHFAARFKNGSESGV